MAKPFEFDFDTEWDIHIIKLGYAPGAQSGSDDKFVYRMADLLEEHQKILVKTTKKFKICSDFITIDGAGYFSNWSLVGYTNRISKRTAKGGFCLEKLPDIQKLKLAEWNAKDIAIITHAEASLRSEKNIANPSNKTPKFKCKVRIIEFDGNHTRGRAKYLLVDIVDGLFYYRGVALNATNNREVVSKLLESVG